MLKRGMRVHVRGRRSEQWPYGLSYSPFTGTLQDDVVGDIERVFVIVTNDLLNCNVRVLAADVEVATPRKGSA